MAKTSFGTTPVNKISIGSTLIKKISIGNNLVYSAGNPVTYKVDTNVTYTEEVDYGATALSPKTFTPSKSGWEFVGWRQDATASSSVVGTLVMGDSPITLYAVFRQAVTLTYYNGNATKQTASGYNYYNNGTIVNPTFSVTPATVTNFTFRGWSTSSAGNSGITYSALSNTAIGTSTTLYGLYQQTITVTYYNGNTTKQITTGTRYFSSAGTYVDPTFTIAQTAISGWVNRGWSTATTGNGAISYSALSGTAISENITLYGMYQQNITLTYYSTTTTAATSTGVRYYNSGTNIYVNPTFTVTSPSVSGFTFRGWSTGNSGNGTIGYSALSNTELSANTTLYALFQQTITVTYHNGTVTAATSSGTRYWSAVGGYINPTFTIAAATVSGFSFRGWSTATAGNGAITYTALSNTAIAANITLHALYQQTITVTYYNGNTTKQTTTGTRYFSGVSGYINPTFTIAQNAINGFQTRGWSTASTGDGAISYSRLSNTAIAADVTLYGMYTQAITLTLYNGSTTATTSTGTRYYNSGANTYVNPTFTVTPATISGFSFRGWSTGSVGNGNISYNALSATAIAASVTLHALYQQIITLSYDANGGSGTTVAQTGYRYWSAVGGYINPTFKLSANNFTYSGQMFTKWAMGKADGTQYDVGASITLTANTTFYAIWLASTLTVFSKSARNVVPTIYNTDYVTLGGAFEGNGVTAYTVGCCCGSVWYKVRTDTQTGTITIKTGPYTKATVTLKAFSNNAGHGGNTYRSVTAGDFGTVDKTNLDFIATATGSSLSLTAVGSAYCGSDSSWAECGWYIESIILS